MAAGGGDVPSFGGGSGDGGRLLHCHSAVFMSELVGRTTFARGIVVVVGIVSPTKASAKPICLPSQIVKLQGTSVPIYQYRTEVQQCQALQLKSDVIINYGCFSPIKEGARTQ